MMKPDIEKIRSTLGQYLVAYNDRTNDLTAQLEEAKLSLKIKEEVLDNTEEDNCNLKSQLDESHRNLGIVNERLEEAQKEIERLKDA